MIKYPIYTTLRDNTPVTLRPFRPGNPEDKICYLSGYRKLSDRSKYFRFLCCNHTLTPKELQNLTTVDNINHFALCALDDSQDKPNGIGLARYIRIEKQSPLAECAIIIADAYHNRGLGKLLLSSLICTALQNGIHHFFGYVLPENNAAIYLLRHFKAKIRLEPGPILRADINLLSTPKSLMKSPIDKPSLDQIEKALHF